jgi:hypothetical protein
MKVVKNKIDAFFATRRKGKRQRKAPKIEDKLGKVTSLTFDTVSKLHIFSRSCILRSYKASGVRKPRICEI